MSMLGGGTFPQAWRRPIAPGIVARETTGEPGPRGTPGARGTGTKEYWEHRGTGLRRKGPKGTLGKGLVMIGGRLILSI